jgi:hypothetical protein
MNEFERRLAQQPLRQIPVAWRRDLLARADATARAQPAALRDWLWPSPLAWAALALIWITLAAAFTFGEPVDESMATTASPPRADQETPPSLLAYHTRTDLFRDLSRTQ